MPTKCMTNINTTIPATVTAMTPHELTELGTELIVCNTYHLMIRPGEELIQDLGGLNKFMNWPGLILTDSGGYQAFSLAQTRKLEEGGIRFRSHVDGTEFFLTPQRSMEIQWALGSDLIMVLDECTPFPVTEAQARESMELSMKWEEESLRVFSELAGGGSCQPTHLRAATKRSVSKARRPPPAASEAIRAALSAGF